MDNNKGKQKRISVEKVLKYVEINDICDVVLKVGRRTLIKIGSSAETYGKSATFNKQYYIDETVYENYKDFLDGFKSLMGGNKTVNVLSVDGISPNDINWNNVQGVTLHCNDDELIKKYCLMHVKNCLPLYIIALGAILMFLITIFTSKNPLEEIGLAVFLILIAIFISIYIVRGCFVMKKWIKSQEDMLNVKFNARSFRSLSFGTRLSNDWLIVLGKYAFHKKSIQKMEKLKFEKNSDFHKVQVTVNDIDYIIRTDLESGCNSLLDWYKN